MKHSTEEITMVLRNIDREKEATIEISGTKSVMQKFVTHTDIVADLESVLKSKLETTWDERGGCRIELNDDHFFPLFTHYGNLLEETNPTNRQEVREMIVFKLMQAFSDIF